VTRRRLDHELVRRGLVASRTEARAAVEAGLVRIGGSPATKPATLVDPSDAVSVVASVRPFASRGGDKLLAGLERFGVDPTGRLCLDAGASTGGFTDVLLRGGAARVAAVDVGYGQLAWALRQDPRVEVHERTNVRDLTPGDLSFVPNLVVCDLSFISLRVVLPALVRVSSDGAEFVLLVKPQFEAGRDQVGRGGVVRDTSVWRRVLTETVEACRAQGIDVLGVMASPLPGPAGNVEFLLHGRRGRDRSDVELGPALAEAETLRR
jgi:23S rRNA (cytidine1920-2'-O)/16S rRNA (cytidine1409-2'-O)-methyltransferase